MEIGWTDTCVLIGMGGCQPGRDPRKELSVLAAELYPRCGPEAAG